MISVAMTTYNGEKYVAKQLESILRQTWPADEIIICDDCSTDRTAQIVNEYVEKYKHSGIKLVINKSNLGYVRNFYKSVSLTNGDYVFFADQDDVWYADKIEQSISAMKRLGAAAICTNFKLIDQNDVVIHNRDAYRISDFVLKANKEVLPISFHKLIFGNLVQGCTYCFTKEVKKLYLEVNDSSVIHDYQVMLIAALIGKVFFLNKELLDYRLHSSNSIGFATKNSTGERILKKPKRKPGMVQYLDNLNRVVNIPQLWYYNSLYYLRIPYFCSVIKKRIGI